MPGPAPDRVPTRKIVEELEALGAETFLGSDQAYVDLAAERLRELNALAAQAYVGIPPRAWCVECGHDRKQTYSLHMRYIEALVRIRKLQRKLVIRAARLGRERATHARVEAILEAHVLEQDLQLEAGRRFARQMMTTPGQQLVGALLYRTLGGRQDGAAEA